MSFRSGREEDCPTGGEAVHCDRWRHALVRQARHPPRPFQSFPGLEYGARSLKLPSGRLDDGRAGAKGGGFGDCRPDRQ
jgi:hypothetical protein